MSGTRSRSRPVPAIRDRAARERDDLIIVAHGERGGACDNRALADVAAAVRALCARRAVHAAVLKGEPSLERVLSACSGRTLRLYPLFMSDGYYVRASIPRRIREACMRHGRRPPRIEIDRPFGLEHGLAPMIARHIRSIGTVPPVKTLVLAGHGSTKSDDSRQATQWQAARLRETGICPDVRTAFLENAPFLVDVLSGLPAGPAVVVGFFSGHGQHGGADVPAAIAATGRDDIAYAGPVGAFPEAAALIAHSVARDGGVEAKTVTVY